MSFLNLSVCCLPIGEEKRNVLVGLFFSDSLARRGVNQKSFIKEWNFEYIRFLLAISIKLHCTMGPLFRNKRLALNEMFQRNASKFAIFYV